MTTPTTNTTKHNPAATPRSVPSPAIPRSAAKPSFTTAQPQHVPAKATGGTAMTASLSQMSNISTGSTSGLGVMASNLLGASPSSNLLAFASPAALAGLDIGTPSALLDAAAAASQPMNLSLSDLGISSGKRNEDEERRAKLETVLSKLLSQNHKTRRFGRVSEEGVRRVGRWAGLDVEVEAKWEARNFEGNRPVAVAGKNNVLIDFTFKDNLPTHIDVSFFSEVEAVTAHQAAAAQVLMKDLTPAPGVAAINTKLDRFAANLETLARLDKLSVAGQLNCFEAITGVYESLRKLYEHEKKAAQALVQAKGGCTDIRAERHVMCKNSGRPQMHARRKIGLSLDYWMERAHVFPPSAPKDESAMDIDSQPSSAQQQDDGAQIYAVQITAEASSPDPYTSLRVSSSWLSDAIVKPTEDTDAADLLSGNLTVDWQDPAPTYLSSSDAMDMDTSNTSSAPQKLPSARFVAKLDPPLAMPWTAATQILQSVGVTNTTDFDPLRTYEMSLLQKSTPTTTGAAATSTTTVTNPEGIKVEHKNSLFVPKQDFGYVLREIPFAHPRQIVQLLPVLRQWAALGGVLRGTFLTAASDQAKNGETPSLADFLDSVSISSAQDAVAVDVLLSTSPSPALEVVFPVQVVEADSASVTLSVLPGGALVVGDQNIVVGEGEEAIKAAQRIGRALEITGDVGVWVEWVRKTYGKH